MSEPHKRPFFPRNLGANKQCTDVHALFPHFLNFKCVLQQRIHMHPGAELDSPLLHCVLLALSTEQTKIFCVTLEKEEGEILIASQRSTEDHILPKVVHPPHRRFHHISKERTQALLW
jgi:hypothetical protein